MCEGTQTLKFCTCSSKIDRTKDHWLLSRKHAVQPFDNLTYLVGMIESPYDIDLYERAQCALDKSTFRTNTVARHAILF